MSTAERLVLAESRYAKAVRREDSIRGTYATDLDRKASGDEWDAAWEELQEARRVHETGTNVISAFHGGAL